MGEEGNRIMGILVFGKSSWVLLSTKNPSLGLEYFYTAVHPRIKPPVLDGSH